MNWTTSSVDQLHARQANKFRDTLVKIARQANLNQQLGLKDATNVLQIRIQVKMAALCATRVQTIQKRMERAQPRSMIAFVRKAGFVKGVHAFFAMHALRYFQENLLVHCAYPARFKMRKGKHNVCSAMLIPTQVKMAALCATRVQTIQKRMERAQPRSMIAFVRKAGFVKGVHAFFAMQALRYFQENLLVHCAYPARFKMRKGKHNVCSAMLIPTQVKMAALCATRVQTIQKRMERAQLRSMIARAIMVLFV